MSAPADELDGSPLVTSDHVEDLDLAVRHRGGPVVEEFPIAFAPAEVDVEGDVHPLHVVGHEREILVDVAAIEGLVMRANDCGVVLCGQHMVLLAMKMALP